MINEKSGWSRPSRPIPIAGRIRRTGIFRTISTPRLRIATRSFPSTTTTFSIFEGGGAGRAFAVRVRVRCAGAGLGMAGDGPSVVHHEGSECVASQLVASDDSRSLDVTGAVECFPAGRSDGGSRRSASGQSVSGSEACTVPSADGGALGAGQPPLRTTLLVRLGISGSFVRRPRWTPISWCW